MSVIPRPDVGLMEKAVATQEVIVSGASVVYDARPSALEVMFNVKNEPVHDKTNNLGFRPGPAQTGLYSHRK